MRIVSMVPSWTETLIEAGADVVGRTRFCIHPGERIKGIPAIGGTKEWDLEKLTDLKPDLIILDQEENTKPMGDFEKFPVIVTHVKSVANMPGELRNLARATNLEKLNDMANRFEKLLAKQTPPTDLRSLPAVIEWIRPITQDQRIDTVVYMIWKNPFMCVARETFIGSMIEHVVGHGKIKENKVSYPKVELESLNEETTLLLFSTEPFPFAKQKSEIAKLRFPSAIVDGEKWSWFGIRSLRFLESISDL